MCVVHKQSGTTFLAGIRASRTVFVVGAILIFAHAHANAQAAQVGWVVDARGEWHVNGGHDHLKKFASVPSEGLLSNPAPTDGGYIVVANMHGDIIRQIRCPNATCGVCVQNDNCASPISPLPKAPGQAGYLTAAIDGIKDLFGEHPERYSVHRSRSIGRSCVSEAVLPIGTDGRARLDGLLRNCEAGNYTLEFQAAGSARTGASGEQPAQLTVAWNPANPNELFLVELKPGLFDVRYTRDWMSGSAWVLMSSEPAYDQNASSFKAFAASVDQWGEQVEPETRSAYKRAYLDHLSQAKRN
jgi:hypothetical protein